MQNRVCLSKDFSGDEKSPSQLMHILVNNFKNFEALGAYLIVYNLYLKLEYNILDIMYTITQNCVLKHTYSMLCTVSYTIVTQTQVQ